VAPLLALLDQDLLIYRQQVQFVAGEAALQGEARQAAMAAGHQLHHDRLEVVRRLGLALTGLMADAPARRDAVMTILLDRLEKGPDLLELDRLAFRDSLRTVDHRLALDPTLGSADLQARIKADLADLAEVDRVEALVDAEYRVVVGTPETPGQGGDRVRWQAYVDQLRKLLPAPAPSPAAPFGPAHFGEISGRGLPDKVLVLTFDDGPHRIYTEQIKEILQRTHTPALFFELGNNLGSIDAAGAARLGRRGWGPWPPTTCVPYSGTSKAWTGPTRCPARCPSPVR
jgi:hypothetical protein